MPKEASIITELRVLFRKHNVKGLPSVVRVSLSENLDLYQNLVAQLLLEEGDNCGEYTLRHIVKYVTGKAQKEAAKRLIAKFGRRDNLALVIRYCGACRQEAYEKLEKVDPLNAEMIFRKNIFLTGDNL